MSVKMSSSFTVVGEAPLEVVTSSLMVFEREVPTGTPIILFTSNYKKKRNGIEYAIPAASFSLMEVNSEDDIIPTFSYYSVLALGKKAVSQLQELQLVKGDKVTLKGYLEMGLTLSTKKPGEMVEYRKITLSLNPESFDIDQLNVDSRTGAPKGADVLLSMLVDDLEVSDVPNDATGLFSGTSSGFTPDDISQV